MPIKIEVIGGSSFDKMGDLFNRSRSLLMADLEKAATVYAMDAQSRSKRDYLTGPRPEKLGVKTGRLRSSITSSVKRDGDVVEITNGTNVVYAAVHELGFEGPVNVSAHQRTVKKVFGRDVAITTMAVGAHSRRMNIRKRPFLQPAMMDALPAFEKRISEILGAVPMGDVNAE